MQDDRIGEISKTSFAYRDIIGQDRWETTWTPASANLTTVGAVTISGRFRVVGRKCEFQVMVSAATSVATVAGTSYIPLPLTAKGICGEATMHNMTTNISVGVCVIDIANSRVYPPSQLATPNTLCLAGWFEI